MNKGVMRPSRPFDDGYLLAYSEEHVKYELDMFLWLVELFGDPRATLNASTASQAIRLRNALVESCAIHLRNILYFLYADKPQSTDIVAADYLPPSSLNAIRRSESDRLKAARRRANKEVSHLTTDRMAGSPPEKTWDFVALGAELLPVLRLFAAEAETSRLSPTVAACLR